MNIKKFLLCALTLLVCDHYLLNESKISNIVIRPPENNKVLVKGKTDAKEIGCKVVAVEIIKLDLGKGLPSFSDGGEGTVTVPPNETKDINEYFELECEVQEGINILRICEESAFTNDEKCINSTITVPPGGVFNFIVSSNINSKSDSFVLDRLKNDQSSSFLMILGNIHSSPKDTDDENEYIKRYNKYLFENEKMESLLQAKPLIYTFNDLDFAGKDSGANSKGVGAINSAYRKIFPNFIKKSQEKGIYQTFDMGTVRFIMTDTRTFMDVDKGSYFGNTQKNWLKEQLTEALNEDKVGAIIITVTQPWNYVKDKYDIDIIKQKYKSLEEKIAEEKNVFFEVLKEHKDKHNFYFPKKALLSGDKFKSILLIVGERHLAFDSGRWNNYGSFPMAVAGPLDSWQQCRGGPYSHGSFHDEKHQYLSITVLPQENGVTCLLILGTIANDDEDIGDQTVFIYNTCDPNAYPGRLDRKCPMDWKEKLIHAAILIVVGVLTGFIFFFFFYWRGVYSFSFRYEKLKKA